MKEEKKSSRGKHSGSGGAQTREPVIDRAMELTREDEDIVEGTLQFRKLFCCNLGVHDGSSLSIVYVISEDAHGTFMAPMTVMYVSCLISVGDDGNVGHTGLV